MTLRYHAVEKRAFYAVYCAKPCQPALAYRADTFDLDLPVIGAHRATSIDYPDSPGDRSSRTAASGTIEFVIFEPDFSILSAFGQESFYLSADEQQWTIVRIDRPHALLMPDSDSTYMEIEKVRDFTDRI